MRDRFTESSASVFRNECLLLVVCLCIVGCDGGFRVRGALVARDQSHLSNCTVTLKGPPDALTCCNTTVSPAKIDMHFTVAPSRISYKLVFTCAGFQPVEREFKYGVDASPSKPLELGVITLQPSGR